MTAPNLASVLREHRIVSDVFSPYCACGKWRDKRDDGTAHRAHVAAALHAELLAAQAEAWDEGVRRACGTTRDALVAILLRNPYRAALSASEGD